MHILSSEFLGGFKEKFLCNKLLILTDNFNTGSDLDWEKKSEQSDLIN